MNTAVLFPEFEYGHSQLNKVIESSGFFTIMLKTGEIVHFLPQSAEEFRQWLYSHNIKNIPDQN
ncbi:hypothetical protein [Niabella beijingensis]|uniref:hypothetical protein n=1 Tax=Niabella beijingensis TaxID=2872700 RepID=UPI001CC0D9CF|nr:hypothetical protein [Niabella beijingensis]MBZ4192253.1 hypothetical protein [Niabella beijingensis]